jgi:putative transposase
VRAYRADYPIATMCRVLGVSTSGYYAWLKRSPSATAKRDAVLKVQVEEIYRRSRGTYGRPRIHAELKENGERVSPKRVARLMKASGLRGVCRRRRVITTQREDQSRPAPDLVQRRFCAEGPDQLWVADITHIPTQSGFCTSRSSSTPGAGAW